LNGWLATDLPEKFPAALPVGVEEPRVAIEDGLLRVAARYRDKTVSSVLSFALQVQLADEPNLLAVRIREVRAGALPIPMNGWLEKVRRAIQRTNLVVRWSQSGGDPVALVELPSHRSEQSKQSLTLEMIAIEPGLVRLSGTTNSVPERDGEPLDLEPAGVIQQTSLKGFGEKRTLHP
jgi:hypothetical protein